MDPMDPNREPQDFNSSDIEFEPPAATRRPGPGQASIEQIITRASEFRLSSKKTVKQLELNTGAPGTRENQERWVTRFNSFRENVLHQSPTTPFTGEDILRFCDVIIS
jgi:hypothetical protein